MSALEYRNAVEELGLLPVPRLIELPAGAPTQHQLVLNAESTLSAAPALAGARRWFAGALGAATGWELFPALPGTSASIKLELDKSLAAEAYTLDITDSVIIRAADQAGAFYGVQTLLQLLGPRALRKAPLETFDELTLQQLHLEDAPRYGYRGVMLDVARHFMPQAAVLNFIEVMAAHKLNVLHLHLSDDQGWRVEIKAFPRLTEVGAWRTESSLGSWRSGLYDGRPHGGYYTQDDLREIVAFAADRSITVIPEIDVPGHSQAAISAYPQLGTGEPIEVWRRWGINPTVLEITEYSIEFYKAVLDEIIEIFPSKWISLGGDEVPLTQWENSANAAAKVAELGLASVADLHSWFIGQLAEHLQTHGRSTHVWDEIGDGVLPAGAVVASWRGYDGGIAALRAGFDVVMCPEHKVYLDHRSAEGDEEPIPVGFVTTLEDVYSFELVPEGFDANAQELSGTLLGAQANIWTEQLDSPRRVHFAAFPRLSALAEVFWSDPRGRDYTEFVQRLQTHHLPRLEAMGVEYRPMDGPRPWQKRPGIIGFKRDYAAEQAAQSVELG